MSEFERWQQCWLRLTGRLPAARWWLELQQQYNAPQRAYHTLQHLAECLQHFDAVRSLLQYPDEVEVALWCHDVIYDTHRRDNEEASAQWAQQLLQETDAPSATSQRITDWIRLTKHMAEPVDADGAFLLDIDLAILGADKERFAEYEQQVRQEYNWVAWPAFCTGRAQILQSFLQRPTIYRTPFFQARFEAQARTNLTASLHTLRQSVEANQSPQ
ncbi:MAG: N-methyl-D-aspartate receptor NMDAR2C subunit [Caldilinea sp. CFX5]|nr:N-methyl-D-aspartate receptor NMDAR2C subunit [Caldilinea sp. CFX5]